MDERRLIDKLRNGDAQAFDDFVSAYQDRVYRLCCRMTTANDAEDLTQEVFVAIFKSIQAFEGKSKLSTWVYRIAVNTCLMKRRKRHLDEVELDEALYSQPAEVDVEASAIMNLNSEIIMKAIDALDETHRLVVVLHELHQLTYAEVAETLNIPVGTVKSRLHNAFKRLRNMLCDKPAEAM